MRVERDDVARLDRRGNNSYSVVLEYERVMLGSSDDGIQ
jgi:hypothetical protein